MQRIILTLAALALSAAPAAALDLPARKPGLWELRMVLAGLPAQTFHHCIDAETDKLMNASFGGMQAQNCTKQEKHKEGDAIVIDSVCKTGAGTVAAHIVVSGDFGRAYTMKISTKRKRGTGRSDLPDGIEMTIEAKYAGACKPGQKPGDIIMPTGITINIRTLLKGTHGAPPRG